MTVTLPPIEASQPCYKCHRTGPTVVDRYPQQAGMWDSTERFMHQYGLCPQMPTVVAVDAASLPFESVVAGRGCVFIKLAKSDEPTLPWRGTTDGMYVNQYGDDEITDMIQRDEATILRVGAGAS